MEPARVLICGGGVAALEALLALRELLAIRPHVVLVAPNRRFVYAPMAVAEPFGLARTRLFGLDELAGELGAELHHGMLEQVAPGERRVLLADGTWMSYDALIVAVGARRHGWLDGATPFGGPDDVPAFEALLERVNSGAASRLAFAMPPGASWTLPVYELALLTAAHVAERATHGVRIEIVTPEADPLAIFGAVASRMLRDQLADRGVHVHAGAVAEALAHGRLRLRSGELLEVEEVVALPRLEGPRVAGLPADEDGFIAVDERCRVPGCSDVYAAGDGTICPYKQGGIAAQQADVAAANLAASLGLPGAAPEFEPVLRGMLLTGVAPMYLRAKLGKAKVRGEVAANALWWPPTKIAGRHLGPYLASTGSFEQHRALEDRRVASSDPKRLEDAHREARELALVLAEADADGGDYRSAVAWLNVVERMDGVLSQGDRQTREDWRSRADG